MRKSNESIYKQSFAMMWLNTVQDRYMFTVIFPGLTCKIISGDIRLTCFVRGSHWLTLKSQGLTSFIWIFKLCNRL